jgi:hypothetical protein
MNFQNSHSYGESALWVWSSEVDDLKSRVSNLTPVKQRPKIFKKSETHTQENMDDDKPWHEIASDKTQKTKVNYSFQIILNYIKKPWEQGGISRITAVKTYIEVQNPGFFRG